MDFKLSAFEGPLDLLFHLIKKNEIDIYDIPIAQLTDQYLEYISSFDFASADSMNSMSEFIVMAATLLEIKSKLLLPLPKTEAEEVVDEQQLLLNRLVEYRAFKLLSEQLKQLAGHDDMLFFREGKDELNRIVKKKKPVSVDNVLEGITLTYLYTIFSDIINRNEQAVEKINKDFKAIVKDFVTVNEKINELVELLGRSGGTPLSFKSIIGKSSGKLEKVISFLALLELLKLNKVTIYQERIFDDIFVTSL